MEPLISSSSENAQTATKLQSIYDFMKEQEEMDSPKGAEGGALLTPSNLTENQRNAFLQRERERFEAEMKAQKAAVESERVRIEQQASDAVVEMGATNWVGRLLGNFSPLFRIPRLIYHRVSPSSPCAWRRRADLHR